MIKLYNSYEYLKTLLEDFFGLGATNSAVDSNLFITSDTEGSHCVTGLGKNRLLAGKLFQHLRRSGQSVARFTYADVETKLTNAHFTHRVLLLRSRLAARLLLTITKWSIIICHNSLVILQPLAQTKRPQYVARLYSYSWQGFF